MTGSPALEKLLNSTVIVAVIGLFGAFLTSQFQDRAKRNEIGLVAFRESQTAQTQVVTEAFNTIGACIAAVDDFIALTSTDFSTNGRSAAEKLRMMTFFEETQVRHDKADVSWRGGKYSVGYRLVYHHEGRVEVAQKWTSLVSAVDALDDCGTSWYMQHGPVKTNAIVLKQVSRLSPERSMPTTDTSGIPARLIRPRRSNRCHLKRPAPQPPSRLAWYSPPNPGYPQGVGDRHHGA